ncbi:MAG: precorrin-4 C(11)-methyltransferase [Prevotella sp.]|nr:precorrin-4 C(11)-methyltransferase [Prevotella sp.]
MKTALIEISAESHRVALAIEKAWGEPMEHISRKDVGSCFHHFDAFIFIGAMGICVRTIAPFIEDKHTDPAVVCIDSTGRHVVSVLSGHVGGANELTRKIAEALKAEPVITTQSDNTGLWALDLLAGKYGWQCREQMNDAIFAFVNRKPTALLLDIRDAGTDELERTMPDHVTLVSSIDDIKTGQYALAIIVSHRHYEPVAGFKVLQYFPKVLTVGIGLAHQAPHVGQILSSIERIMEDNGLDMRAVRDYATIDVKADEPVVKCLQERGDTVHFFTAEALSPVAVPTPSSVVEQHVGTPSVSEAAALLASGDGLLLLPKQKDHSKEFTFAVAINRKHLREGHIEIVGAGPGDPDLVSVRGRRMLERADLILYAGSLVPRELTECHKPGAVVRSSAGMDLDEQCSLMKEFYDKGKFIVRLHTGDPCIFGAIQEQMAFFDKHHMAYHITPGISSFLAAAAELRSQFTIPERCQTIILTRGEGRTPMPEREKLHLLARSQSTMCIFLSAAIVDDVQAELLQEYPETTPVAACYHLTWPDQRIYRGQLKDLAKMVHDNHLTLTTMLVVGEAIDNREHLSKLYDRRFTHLFREGKQE